MGVKADLAAHDNSDKPFFVSSGGYTSGCRKIECGKSKNGPRGTFKFFFVPTDEAMKGMGVTPLDYPQFEDELDANIPRDWAIIKDLVGDPKRGQKGGIEWVGGKLMWNGLLGGDQVVAGTLDVLIKTTEPKPKAQGGGFWDAKYKVDDYEVAGFYAQAASEGLAACLDDIADEEPADPTPAQPTKGGKKR